MRSLARCLPLAVVLACTGDEPAATTTSTTDATTSGAASTGGSAASTSDAAEPTTTATTATTTTVATTTEITGSPACEPNASAPCYTGAPGTEDVGPCRGGTQTCAPDGSGLGACEGEVVPGVEDCATPDDEDCDGRTPLCPGAAYWAKRFGDAEDQLPGGIWTGPDGGSVLVGAAQGSIDFGLGPLVSEGDHDVVLARFAADGAPQWAHRYGSPDNQNGAALAVDGAGRIAITGTLHGPTDFGGGTLTETGYADAYLAVYTADGEHVWSKNFGDDLHQFGDAVAVAPDDEIVLAGSASGTTDFGGGPRVSAGSGDLYVARFTGDGAHVWSRLYGDAGSQDLAALAIQPSGQIVIAGWFDGTLELGDSLVSTGENDGFVATLGPDGAPVWGRQFGGPDYQYVNGLALDPGSGRVAVVGQFKGASDLGGGPVVSAGDHDAFVAVFTAAGEPVWSRHFGDAALQTARGVAFTHAGDVLLTGYFHGAIDLGGGPLVSAGDADLFLARFTASGEHVRSDRYGDAGYQFGRHVAVDPTGAVFLAGTFGGTLTIGGVALVGVDQTDIFFARIGY